MLHRLTTSVFAVVVALGIQQPAAAQDIGCGPRTPETGTTAGCALRELVRFAQDPTLLGTLLPQVASNLVTTQIATFPTAASSAAYTYTFNPRLGFMERGTASFGPLFVERPVTAGRGKVALSLDGQHTTWQSIDGFDLKRGDLNSSVGGFEQAFIDLRTTTSVVSLNIGVGANVDVGVSVPFLTVTVTGSALNGALNVKGTSHGVGDVRFRSKIALPSVRTISLGTLVECRLPTGNASELRGAGKPQLRVLGIAARTVRHMAIHGTAGYTFAGAGAPPDLGLINVVQRELEPSDEIEIAGGVDIAMGSRLTVGTDVLGRVLRNSAQIRRQGAFLALQHRDGLPLLVGVTGVKVEVAGHWLLKANVLFAMSENGLAPGVTPVIGLERGF